MRLFHSFILSACLLFVVVGLNILQNRYYMQYQEFSTKKSQIKPTKQTVSNKKTKNTLLTFYNAIEKNNLGYKHWTGTYYPNTFALRVNNILLEQNKKTVVPVTDNTCTVRIDYSFVNGRRTGGIVATYKFDTNIPIHICTFTSWHDDERLVISDAKYCHHERDTFDSTMKHVSCYS